MKFIPNEKGKRISLQNAKREHARTWGRFRFIHAGYIPYRFRNKMYNAKSNPPAVAGLVD